MLEKGVEVGLEETGGEEKGWGWMNGMRSWDGTRRGRMRELGGGREGMGREGMG